MSHGRVIGFSEGREYGSQSEGTEEQKPREEYSIEDYYPGDEDPFHLG